MLKLPEVTLICVTNKDFEGHKKAIDKSCEQIEFGAVKLIWDEKIRNVDDWSRVIIYDLYKYVDTEFCLLIHADGYVIHPELWNPDWLKLDFIGSPFPLPTDDFSYRDESGDIQRVGNSVSLRSKKLMELIATREWKPYYGYYNEDGFISCHNRKWLESQGCMFGTFEQALVFGKEAPLPENEGKKTFVFHKYE